MSEKPHPFAKKTALAPAPDPNEVQWRVQSWFPELGEAKLRTLKAFHTELFEV